MLSKCPVCDSSDVSIKRKANFYTLLKCNYCSCLYKKIEDYKIYSYYNELFKNDSSAEATPEFILSQIMEKVITPLNLSKSANILDFGCGKGDFIEILRQKGFNNVYGVEPYRDILGINDDMIYRDVCAIPKKINFDLILLIEVLEHIESPRKVMNSLLSRLKRGGYIFITTPNNNSLKAIIKRTNWKEISRPSHLVIYNKKSLCLLLTYFFDIELKFVKNIYYTKHRILEFLLNIFGLTGNIRCLGRKV